MAFLIQRGPINVSRRRLSKQTRRHFGPKTIELIARSVYPANLVSESLHSPSTQSLESVQADVSSPDSPASAKVHISRINAQILDIEERKVILQCLLDPDLHEFQVRSFDRDLFAGLEGIEIGKFVEIEIQSEPGKRIFVFRSIDGAHLKPIFDLDLMVDALSQSPIFQKMPPVDEGDI